MVLGVVLSMVLGVVLGVVLSIVLGVVLGDTGSRYGGLVAGTWGSPVASGVGTAGKKKQEAGSQVKAAWST